MAITREEAQERAAIVQPALCCVDLDLSAGAQTFHSTTTLTFAAAPGRSTFVDLDARQILSARLNGRELPTQAWHDSRLLLDSLEAENALVVTAVMGYGRDGQGLHRASDPVDGHDYVYGHLFMDAAPRVFACFDQPDLKVAYEVTVRVPQGWVVITNGAARQVEAGTWTASRTKPLATYFVTVCAGPFASVREEHDGIPLALFARESLRHQLETQANDIFAITKASLDYYHSLFGIRYPFGEYNQVFVPEFNAGAMENPGCVTFRDQLIFTGAASRAEHLSRASTIAHEMAHMWFGDLVTMQWWDDLWLNESFAEYLATRTLVEVTPYTDAWVAVAAGRKAWGYAAERSPSTHPVAGAPAPDTDTALQNFDGISYAKGSAVLRQLILRIGDENFITGIRIYLQRYMYGNATLGNFLAALEGASGQDLSAWAQAWLETAGMDTMRVDRAARGGLKLVIAPEGACPAKREHAVQISAYADQGCELARDELAVATGVVALPAVDAALRDAGRKVAIVPNSGDLTWAGVELDDVTLALLPQLLPGLVDATTRATLWTGLAHGLATAAVAPDHVLGIANSALPSETHASVIDGALQTVHAVVGRFLPWAARPAALARFAALAEELLESETETGDSRALAGARLAAATASAERLRPWFEEPKSRLRFLQEDALFGWRVAHRLAQLDAVSLDELDTALDADPTMSGRLGYLTARAAFPDPVSKEWAWEELTAPPAELGVAHSNYEMNALASGFWSGGTESTLAPYVERYVNDIPRMRGWVGEDALARVAVLMFPIGLASEQLDVEARRMLQSDLPAAVRRAVIDQQALVREVLASRTAFPPASESP